MGTGAMVGLEVEKWCDKAERRADATAVLRKDRKTFGLAGMTQSRAVGVAGEARLGERLCSLQTNVLRMKAAAQ